MTLLNTDLEVSPVFLGTADICPLSDAEIDRLIGTYRDCGGRVLDTAHVYSFWIPGGDGCSERNVAAALARLDASELVVATKGGHPSIAGYRSCTDWLSPHRVRADIEDSLGRLNRDAIDLYYLHRDDTALPVSEIVETMATFAAEGLIRYYGVSNWSPSRVAEAQSYASANDYPAPVISQCKFSLAAEPASQPQPRGDQIRVIQSEDRRYHADSQVPLAAFASTAGGYFEQPDPPRKSVDREENRQRRDRVRQLAGTRGVSPTQIALAWLIARPFPCFPITGTTNPDHLNQNCRAAEIGLSDHECDWLDGAT